MVRGMIAALGLMVLTGCAEAAAEAEGSRAWTIDAPRERVFQSAAKPSNIMAFNRVRNGAVYEDYEFVIAEDGLIAFDRDEARPIFEEFDGSVIAVQTKRDDRITVELRPKTGGRTLRYRLVFADGAAAGQTEAKLEIDESEGPLTPEQQGQMDRFIRMMSGVMGPRMMRRVEHGLESAPVETMDDLMAQQRELAVREAIRDE